MSFFEKHLGELADSISQIALTNTNRAGLYEIVYEVFTGMRRGVSLSDIFPSLLGVAWEPAKIGPDPYAVMQASARINGIVFRLVATRIYVPRYFRFVPELECDPDIAEPLGSKLKIMWSAPAKWRDAAQAYLLAPEDDWDAELVLPDDALDELMARHATWFEKSMGMIREANYYTEDEDNRLIPHLTPWGPYAIFGTPCDATSTLAKWIPKIECRVTSSMGNQLIMVDGWPLCLEWYPAQGTSTEDDGAFDEASPIRDVAFDHLPCGNAMPPMPELPFVLRPATGFDVRHALKIEVEAADGEEALMLKSDVPELAKRVLDLIASRQVRVDRRDPRRYLLVLDVSAYSEVKSLHLTLDIHWNSGFLAANLISESVCLDRGGERTLSLSLHRMALSLVKLVGKKPLADALAYGLIVHCPGGVADGLKVEPPWVEKLLDVDPSVASLFDCPLPKEITIFDLFRNARRVTYKRDNR